MMLGVGRRTVKTPFRARTASRAWTASVSARHCPGFGGRENHGILTLEPNGAFVQTLQSTGPREIALGPIGIMVVGRSARLSGSRWILMFVVRGPLLLVLWFVSVAYLGGLAGEPF